MGANSSSSQDCEVLPDPLISQLNRRKARRNVAPTTTVIKKTELTEHLKECLNWHQMKPWLKKRVKINLITPVEKGPLNPQLSVFVKETIDQEKREGKYPLNNTEYLNIQKHGDGRLWYVPSVHFWNLHCHVTHRKDAQVACEMRGSIKTYTDKDGNSQKFIMGVLFVDETFKILDESDYQKECEWWKNKNVGNTTMSEKKKIYLTMNLAQTEQITKIRELVIAKLFVTFSKAYKVTKMTTIHESCSMCQLNKDKLIYKDNLTDAVISQSDPESEPIDSHMLCQKCQNMRETVIKIESIYYESTLISKSVTVYDYLVRILLLDTFMDANSPVGVYTLTFRERLIQGYYQNENLPYLEMGDYFPELIYSQKTVEITKIQKYIRDYVDLEVTEVISEVIRYYNRSMRINITTQNALIEPTELKSLKKPRDYCVNKNDVATIKEQDIILYEDPKTKVIYCFQLQDILSGKIKINPYTKEALTKEFLIKIQKEYGHLRSNKPSPKLVELPREGKEKEEKIPESAIIQEKVKCNYCFQKIKEEKYRLGQLVNGAKGLRGEVLQFCSSECIDKYNQMEEKVGNHLSKVEMEQRIIHMKKQEQMNSLKTKRNYEDKITLLQREIREAQNKVKEKGFLESELRTQIAMNEQLKRTISRIETKEQELKNLIAQKDKQIKTSTVPDKLNKVSLQDLMNPNLMERSQLTRDKLMLEKNLIEAQKTLAMQKQKVAKVEKEAKEVEQKLATQEKLTDIIENNRKLIEKHLAEIEQLNEKIAEEEKLIVNAKQTNTLQADKIRVLEEKISQLTSSGEKLNRTDSRELSKLQKQLAETQAELESQKQAEQTERIRNQQQIQALEIKIQQADNESQVKLAQQLVVFKQKEEKYQEDETRRIAEEAQYKVDAEQQYAQAQEVVQQLNTRISELESTINQKAQLESYVTIEGQKYSSQIAEMQATISQYQQFIQELELQKNASEQKQEEISDQLDLLIQQVGNDTQLQDTYAQKITEMEDELSNNITEIEDIVHQRDDLLQQLTALTEENVKCQTDHANDTQLQESIAKIKELENIQASYQATLIQLKGALKDKEMCTQQLQQCGGQLEQAPQVNEQETMRRVQEEGERIRSQLQVEYESKLAEYVNRSREELTILEQGIQQTEGQKMKQLQDQLNVRTAELQNLTEKLESELRLKSIENQKILKDAEQMAISERQHLDQVYQEKLRTAQLDNQKHLSDLQNVLLQNGNTQAQVKAAMELELQKMKEGDTSRAQTHQEEQQAILTEYAEYKTRQEAQIAQYTQTYNAQLQELQREQQERAENERKERAEFMAGVEDAYVQKVHALQEQFALEKQKLIASVQTSPNHNEDMLRIQAEAEQKLEQAHKELDDLASANKELREQVSKEQEKEIKSQSEQPIVKLSNPIEEKVVRFDVPDTPPTRPKRPTISYGAQVNDDQDEAQIARTHDLNDVLKAKFQETNPSSITSQMSTFQPSTNSLSSPSLPSLPSFSQSLSFSQPSSTSVSANSVNIDKSVSTKSEEDDISGLVNMINGLKNKLEARK